MTTHKRTATRFAAIFGALAAALVLASCGGESATGGSGPAEGNSDVSDLSVGYVDGSCANSWRVTVRAELEDEIKKHPEISDFKYVCAQGELNQAISSIQSMTAQGVDILLVFSDWGDPLLPAVRKAYKDGTVVVPWDVPVGGEAGTDFTAFVGDDFEQLGRFAAEYFIDKLDGEGKIVGMGGPAGNSFDNEYVDEMKKVFADQAPGIEYLETGWADWNPAKAAQVMNTFLSKYPQIDGVFNTEATMVPAEIKAFQAANRDLPVFYSWDVNGILGEYLKLKPKNPTMELGFASARTWGVRQALEVGLMAAKGEEIPDNLLLLDNFVEDCAETCEERFRPDMPDSYIPTSKVPAEEMKALLEE